MFIADRATSIASQGGFQGPGAALAGNSDDLGRTASTPKAQQTAARVDMLVTDVGLPGGMNGRQVADAAREGRPGLPALFITGYAGRALEGQLAPGMEVIGKPFALDALTAKVRAMLEAAPAA